MPPAEGREAIREFIAGFMAAFDGIDFTVHRQIAQGNIVMNERTDVMRRQDGGRGRTAGDGRVRGARR